MPSKSSAVKQLGGDFLRYLRGLARAGLIVHPDGELSRFLTSAIPDLCGVAAAVEGPARQLEATGQRDSRTAEG